MKKTYSTPLVTASDVVIETLAPGSIKGKTEVNFVTSRTLGMGYGL